MQKLVPLAFIGVLLVACGGSNGGSDGPGGNGGNGGAGGAGGATGHGIGVYAVEPPVTANTPMGLKGAKFIFDSDAGTDGGGDGGPGDVGPSDGGPSDGATSDGATSDGGMGLDPITIIKTRFFEMGSGSMRDILKHVDERMIELDTSAKNAPHVCLDEPGKDFAITTPLDLGFPQRLSCVTKAGTGWIAFGHKADVWFMREGQQNGIGLLVREDAASNVEGWMIVAEKAELETMSQELMHFKSTKATGLLEFTVTGKNLGVGCGVQFQSLTTTSGPPKSLIYITGKLADPGMCAESSTKSVCIDGSTAALAERDVADCKAAKLDVFTLPSLTEATIDYKDIYKIGSQPVEGITDFSVIGEVDGGADGGAPDGGAPDGSGPDGSGPDGGAGS